MKNLLTLSIIFFLSACAPPKMVFEGALCIENIAIVDAKFELQQNYTVVLKDGKILRVAPSSELPLASTNEIIDGTGKYMIPGLWDAHVHFAFMEELAPSMFNLFLGYGITSVRDTGGEIGFVKKWKDKALVNRTDAPRVMIAGPLLDGMPNVYDGSDPMHPPLSVGLASVEDVEQQVEELANQDVDLLKAYEMLSPDQFRALTKIAQEKGLKVTGHVPLSMDVISASNAGLNSMEHMRNLELSCASNSDELLAQRQQLLADGANDLGGTLRSSIHQAQREVAVKNYDEARADEVLKVLAQNQTWQIPTLALSTGAVEKPFSDPEFQQSFEYLPDAIKAQWLAGIQAFEEGEATSFQQQHGQWMFNMVGKVHEAGIDIMAGTDCPIFFLTPGRSLHEELAVLVKAGLSPKEALKTATINPARYFGLENELGTIQENMWADLVILDANPLEDIGNTLEINAVVKEGKYFGREELDGLLGQR